MPKGSGSAGSAAVRFMTAGTYQREVEAQTSFQLVAATEYEIAIVANNILAGAVSDQLFSWIRLNTLIGTAAESLAVEWALIKCTATDATQDMNSAAQMEILQKEGRVFGRGLLQHGSQSTTGYAKLSVEFYNVKLLIGEELRLLLRPLVGTVAATCNAYSVIEWRKVGS